MRSSEKPATLKELMGGGEKESLTLEDLPKLLGEKMPKIEYNRIGRMRLLNALQIRFGQGYRNLPGVEGIVKQFDSESHVQNLVRMNKRR